MFNSKKFILLSVLFLSFISSSIFSQDIGQIFGKKEADELFGPVLESRAITTDELKVLLLSVEDKVMFRLENNQISILADSRNLLYSTTNFIESNQVFHMYSKSKVLDLLYKDSSTTVTLENRKEVFSITNGNYTLEMSNPCPPNCE